MQEVIADSLIYSPGRSVSTYLDPGLWEQWQGNPGSAGSSFPFLYTAQKNWTFNPHLLDSIKNDWIFWVLLAGFIALTFTRFYHARRLKMLGSSVFKHSAALQLIREGPVHAHRSFLLLVVIYVVSMTLLIQQTGEFFSPGSSQGILSLLTYLQFLAFYLAFILLKFLVIWLTGIIFKNVDTAREYIQNILIYNVVQGILLLPLLVLIIYIYPQVFLYITLSIILIMIILRFIRGIMIGLSDPKFTLFHLFMYLCTLEILPLAFAAKIVSKYFFS